MAPGFARAPAIGALTKGAGSPLSASIDGLSLKERNRERGKGSPDSAAAPATVSGEPQAIEPLGRTREGGGG